MRIFIFSLLAVFIFSCNKEPVNDQGTNVPGGRDTSHLDTTALATHLLILGTTNDSLVLWKDDTVHFLHSHYNEQSRATGGQMILVDSTIYIAGGNEDHKAVYYKNFAKKTLSSYYSHASSIYADDGHVFVAGFTTDRGDGHNTGETYATYWVDGKRDSYFSPGSQFHFISHQDTTTVLLGFEMGYNYSADRGPGIYIKNNQLLPLSSFNAEAKRMIVKDTTTYIVGNIFFNGWEPQATLWKNGKEIYINSLSGESQATAIFINGKDVYISGSIGRSAVYWKNGVAVQLDENGSARDIKVIGNDIYVVGQYLDEKAGKRLAALWKNGIKTKLSKSDQQSDAFSVVLL